MRSLSAVLLALLLTCGVVRADEAADKADIQAVIGGQIEAFRADDGATAYSFAAPKLQQAFRNPDVFMSMVRSGYQPVYRPRSVIYGRFAAVAGGYAQEVLVVGPDGETYTALYALERQPDGSWRIAGCQIIKTTAQPA